ncbi:hypothetical protein ACQ4PT_017999 [Festuca glaucescens]
MPSDRAPGPDGFITVFYQRAWPTIKVDIMAGLIKLGTGDGRGFARLNRAIITLIPKKQGAAEIGDYMPISLVHSFSKLFSKLVANRLRTRLGDIVSANQSAFVRGRCLHDNFVLVRQVARRVNQKKVPGVLLKLDLSRAFDSMSWAFPFEVLRRRGFGALFLKWIALLLYMANTRVTVNGVPGDRIHHVQGLRQGDPTSPMLFVAAMEVLTAIVAKAVHNGILENLANVSPLQRLSIYADDVVLFFKPARKEIIAVKEILSLFGESFGLRPNFRKTTATVIRGSDVDKARVQAILGCQLAEFPIKYLGLQLALRPLTRAQWMPTLDSIAHIIPTWQRSMITRASRLVLVKTVITARPVHHMLVEAAPGWMLEEAAKCMQAFFWAGKKEANGGQCLVAWDSVCKPLRLGGLGIKNLRMQGVALRVRWEWLQRTDSSRPWKGLRMANDHQASEVLNSLATVQPRPPHIGFPAAASSVPVLLSRTISFSLYRIEPLRRHGAPQRHGPPLPDLNSTAGSPAACPSSTRALFCSPPGAAHTIDQRLLLCLISVDQCLSTSSFTTGEGFVVVAQDVMEELLLEHEVAFGQGHSADLWNTHEAGTIYVTNFRLIFVSKATKSVVELGTIPLTAIDELKDVPSKGYQRLLPPERSMLEIRGHDTRVIVFIFKSENKHLKKMIDDLKKWIKPVHLEHIYAFSSKPPADMAMSSAMRLYKEYHRLFHKWFAQSPSTSFEARAHLQNKWWRVSEINSGYKLCESYPTQLIVPNSIRYFLMKTFFWLLLTGWVVVFLLFPGLIMGLELVLARSSQPKIQYLRVRDELVSALRTPSIHHTDPQRKLYIVDVRDKISAVGNMAKGGGSELGSVYEDTEVCYSEVNNIHAMRTCFHGLRQYVNAYGSISSDGAPLHERDPISVWTQAPKSVVDISKLQTWLSHIQSILTGASYITAKITGESASVLVHCSDGWDRTSQLVSLSCLLLDPFYRTFSGFQALVEKDWLAFGHKFSARMGLPNKMAGEKPPKYELPWHAVGSIQSVKERSPIILQWLECIAHLLFMYPCAFEFSSKFLVDFMDAVLSCRFGNFLCDSERDREQADVASCLCIWKYLADLRASDNLHEHRNPLYDPQRHNGPIVPPPPALVPTLWSQFYLRWSCPMESLGGVGVQELVKLKIAAKLIGEFECLPIDEIHPIGEKSIRVVGSNVKKL